MKIVVFEPYEDPYVKEVESPQEFEHIVGGPIQSFPLEGRMAVICNDLARIQDLPKNQIFVVDDKPELIYGTCLVCGRYGDELCGLDDRQIRIITE